ncbi:hypothetical protein KCU93_g283, partial [Aureobasidium melanogenum]
MAVVAPSLHRIQLRMYCSIPNHAVSMGENLPILRQRTSYRPSLTEFEDCLPVYYRNKAVSTEKQQSLYSGSVELESLSDCESRGQRFTGEYVLRRKQTEGTHNGMSFVAFLALRYRPRSFCCIPDLIDLSVSVDMACTPADAQDCEICEDVQGLQDCKCV